MPSDDRALYIISVAAELAGVHPQTLRIYERKGLIEPARTVGRSRRYSDRDIALLRRIQELTNEGVGLAGVRRILELEDDRSTELRQQIERTRRDARDAVEHVHRTYRRDLVPLRQAIVPTPPAFRTAAGGRRRPRSTARPPGSSESGRGSRAEPLLDRGAGRRVPELHQLVERAEVEHRDPVDRRADVEVAEVRGAAAAELGDPHEHPDDPGHLRGRRARVDPLQQPLPARRPPRSPGSAPARTSRLLPTSTAMTVIPSCRLRMIPTGMLSSTPPSTRRSPSALRIGGNTPGIEKLARRREPTRPGAVHLDLAAGEVGRDAEPVEPHVLHVQADGGVLHPLRHPRAGRDRDRRERDSRPATCR